MFDPVVFALSDMVEASTALRLCGKGATNMEQVAGAAVQYLYDNLVDKRSGQRSCALVRFYKTQPYEALPRSLQDAARAAADDHRVWTGVNCLTLLATAGDNAEWNDRNASRAHRAIPLRSVAALERLPMVSQLVRQLGVDPVQVVRPDSALFTEFDQRAYNVFHVPRALGSRHVPAQDDFVLRYGIASALGFGGVLPSGALFAIIMFSRVAIPRETAERFSTLAISLKLAILPFDGGQIFAGDLAVDNDRPAMDQDPAKLRSQVAALSQLVEVREASVLRQANRLEAALTEAEDRASELAVAQEALTQSEARKGAVIDSALDAIVTMDHSGAIIEFNPAAERTFGYQRHEVLGRPLAEVLVPASLRDRHKRGVEDYLRTGVGPILGRRIELTAMRAGGDEFPVELTVAPVTVPDSQPAFTGFIRDITARQAAERALRDTRQRALRIARTLQDSLLPPALPSIAGVELGSCYHPAGDGSTVGGDFYDVFQTGRNDWALVIGDACGKGVDAAALTALARYTIRAAAIRARKPSSVLRVLNQAIHAQYPERFCTAIYVRLVRVNDTVRLTVAAGGHPLPLLVSPHGSVLEVGRPGLPMGMFTDTVFSDETFDLPVGTSVVLHTDGITEARRAGMMFGDQRLRALLATMAGRAPADLASAIERAALDYQGGNAGDDIAVLACRRLR